MTVDAGHAQEHAPDVGAVVRAPVAVAQPTGGQLLAPGYIEPPIPVEPFDPDPNPFPPDPEERKLPLPPYVPRPGQFR